MRVWYNDNDPFVGAWLRRLMRAGVIPVGDLDRRSIVNVRAEDFDDHEQCHFFAGVGGWPYALELAGWPIDRPVWTASPPCQPLSSIGQRRAHADQRHLWPAFYRLVAELKPATIFGEQLATPDGREWFAGIRADLERAGYAVGCANLPAAAAGAPHKRARLFFVADTSEGRRAIERAPRLHDQRASGHDAVRCGTTDSMGVAGGARLEGFDRHGDDAQRWQIQDRPAAAAGASRAWDDFEVIELSDGTRRRVESGLQPLAHGTAARVGRLRAYGNAIVPALAAIFIRAWLELDR